jgi:hypothetical protein
MLEHGDRFDDLLHRQRSDAVGALPLGAGSTKVTAASNEPSRYVRSPQVLAAMERNWAETMDASFGLSDYAEVVDALRSR